MRAASGWQLERKHLEMSADTLPSARNAARNASQVALKIETEDYSDDQGTMLKFSEVFSPKIVTNRIKLWSQHRPGTNVKILSIFVGKNGGMV
jgi:hypothetical protein